MARNLTVRTLLAQAIEDLRGASAEPASVPLDAELLLGHALGMSRAQIRSHPETVPTDERVQRYGRLVQRRKLGEPVAYITGQREFWSLPLAVSPAVLVPRPETELLVERALSLHPQATARVLELGTGSGAIALALASDRPAWRITATDVSEEALVAARVNAATHGLQRVEFLRGSWFTPLTGRVFELVVSNPPYVAETDPALQSPDLTYEPRLALAAGVDGLLCLRAIIREAPQYLERRGWLLLEHGAAQADAVARELVVRGFGHVRSHRDLGGHERLTEAQWL